jgi:hypothetical protein
MKERENKIKRKRINHITKNIIDVFLENISYLNDIYILGSGDKKNVIYNHNCAVNFIKKHGYEKIDMFFNYDYVEKKKEQ